MKDKAQTITFWGAWLFLCCYFMQLFGFPNELTVILGGGICLVMVLQQKRIRLDLGTIMLTITMVSYYVIINGVKGLFFSILYIPVIIYVMTNYMVHSMKNVEEDDKKFKVFLYALVIGVTLHGVLNAYMYLAGYREPGETKWMDFWGQSMVPGTQHAAYFLTALAVLFPSIAYFKRRPFMNLGIIIISLVFCYTALTVRSRMALVIVVLVFFGQALLFLILEREKVKKALLTKRIRLLISISIVLFVIAVFGFLNSNLFESFSSVLSKDGGILNNIRFVAQKDAISQLFVYPMGGMKMQLAGGMKYCHNTWLDMANAAGLIPFFSFCIYTAFAVYEIICFLLKKEIDNESKIITIGLFGAFVLYLMVEPAMAASIHLITPWIFLNGVIHGRLVVKKEKMM